MSEGTQRRLAAIVFINVVGYSRLMGLDEAGTLATLRAHRKEVVDPKIENYGGRIVKTMGDSLLLEFPSVVNATQCALEIQQGMAARSARQSWAQGATYVILLSSSSVSPFASHNFVLSLSMARYQQPSCSSPSS